MDIVLVIARVILAGIFFFAGVGKLSDINGGEKALKDFGVPEKFAKNLAVWLPVAEILLAIFLVINPTAWYAAVIALIFLGGFTAAMLFHIAKGNTLDCHCFGQIHSEPVGWKSVIRNFLFMIPAILILFLGSGDPGADPFFWFDYLSDGEKVLFVLGALISLALSQLMFAIQKIALNQKELQRQIESLQILNEGGSGEKAHEHMTAPNEGLPIGAPAPDFALPDMQGREVSFEQLLMKGRPVLFFFISPTCLPCKALLPEIGKWQDELRGKIEFVFISSGPVEENAAKLPQLGGQVHLLQKKKEVAELLKAKWTPTALLVNSAGAIASRPAAGDIAIRELIEQIQETGADDIDHIENGTGMSPNELKIGESVPEFELPESKGELVTDAAIRGKKTLAVFWGVDCPHCQRMLPEVQEWEKANEGEVQLVVFSGGTGEQNRALELRSPVLSDESGKIGNKFGMFGTPSAVLIDESGKIVSETAIGSEQIWALIGKRK